MKDELAERNIENEGKLKELLREVQIQKEKKKAVEDIAAQRTRKIEA